MVAMAAGHFGAILRRPVLFPLQQIKDKLINKVLFCCLDVLCAHQLAFESSVSETRGDVVRDSGVLREKASMNETFKVLKACFQNQLLAMSNGVSH